jgi:DNA-binding SARP family transcriptional activator
MTTTLLSAMLLRANQVIDSAGLISLLWPGVKPPSADANLRQYVSRVRSFLNEASSRDAARLRSTGGGYLLELRRDELDITCFEDLTASGRLALTTGDLHGAHAYLDAAVSLWSGSMCQGATLGPELEMDILYWEELRLAAQQLLVRTRLHLGQYHQAIAEIRPLLASNPLCEDLWGMLMLAYYRSYRRGDARGVFRAAHRRFVTDLGIEPTADLQRLHQGILRGDSPLDGFTWLSPPILARASGPSGSGPSGSRVSLGDGAPGGAVRPRASTAPAGPPPRPADR